MSLTLLWLPNPCEGLIRRNWIFPQLTSPSTALADKSSRFQLGLSNLTYDSFSSSQGALFLNTGPLEVAVKTSGHLFRTIGLGRTQVNNTLGDWDTSYSFEIARCFISPTGRFGRFGLEFDTFAPSSERFLQFALDTGILESPTEPDMMKLSFHLFQPIKSSADTRIFSQLEFARLISQKEDTKWKAGIGLGWTYQLTQEQTNDYLNSVSDRTLRSEHMFFSLNPSVEYSNQLLVAKLTLPWRLFIDKQWQLRTPPGSSSANTIVTSYPFELANPDWWLSVYFLL